MTIKTITVRREIGEAERASAESQRQLLAAQGVLAVNLLSSPGAGKTTLLEATAKQFANDGVRMAVLVGDLETDRDAQRLAPHCPTAQLTTGGACHLELPLVQRGLEALGEQPIDILFIENVGNLVCPASHDLGEHLRVVLASTTEGDDKPGKYPKMFRTSQAMVVTKLDLLPHVPFSVESVAEDARKIQPSLEVMAVSALRPEDEGVAAWCEYLLDRRAAIINA